MRRTTLDDGFIVTSTTLLVSKVVVWLIVVSPTYDGELNPNRHA